MDLTIVNNDTRILLTTYTKPINLFLYITNDSYQAPAAKKAFIIGRLIDFVRKNSTYELFKSVRADFYKNCCARGHKHSFLVEQLTTINYADRQKYLSPKEKESNKGKILILPNNPLTQNLNINQIFYRAWNELCNENKTLLKRPPMVAWKKARRPGDIVNTHQSKRLCPDHPT